MVTIVSTVEEALTGSQARPPRTSLSSSKEPTVLVPAHPPKVFPAAANALLRLLINAADEQSTPSTVRDLHQDDDDAGQ
jgi:hypothetical protein